MCVFQRERARAREKERERARAKKRESARARKRERARARERERERERASKRVSEREKCMRREGLGSLDPRIEDLDLRVTVRVQGGAGAGKRREGSIQHVVRHREHQTHVVRHRGHQTCGSRGTCQARKANSEHKARCCILGVTLHTSASRECLVLVCLAHMLQAADFRLQVAARFRTRSLSRANQAASAFRPKAAMPL